jgi:peroxiredoxin family protein
MSDAPLNLVLFSGTADKLHAAATLAAGAAAMDQPVNILLQYWALDAFRTERLEQSHGLAWDSTAEGASRPVNGTKAIPWLDTFRLAKKLGTVSVLACSGSLETLGIDVTTLDPIVDESGGIATFLLAAQGGQIVFI